MKKTDQFKQWIKESSRIVVCNGFYFAVIQKECCFNQSLSVTGGAGAHDVGIFRKQAIDFLNGFDGRL